MKKTTPDSIDLDRFSERLAAESDRACAVLGAALVDAKLEAIFRLRLKSFRDELLGNTRPLGSFGARNQLGHALGWISDDVRVDLDLVRGIRNDFAHSFDHELDFKDPSVSDRCATLRTAQAYLDGFEVAAKTSGRNLSTSAIYSMRDVFKPARARYQLAIDFLAQYLDAIGGQPAAYTGEDLLAELRALSANLRVSVHALAHVGPVPEG